eukprot:m.42973 g.42973  ORF g.42973 m.42973 type:complete len:222 (-) comp14388_c0_seq1:166-831(-)
MEKHHTDDNDMANARITPSSAAFAGLAGYGIMQQPMQNPYQAPFDPQHFIQRQQAEGQTAEYLFPEKAAKKKRTLSEHMFYGTGISYLCGQAIGGTWGLYEGLRHADGVTARLRINTVLNGITKRGPFVGNAFGVLALMYNGINGGVVALRGGDDDAINQIAAATTTGLLYKASAGVRPMALAGTLGAVLGVAGVVLGNVLLPTHGSEQPQQKHHDTPHYA